MRKLAIALNNLRIIPRLILVAYFGQLVWVMWWFMLQQDISASQATVITSLIGAAGVFTAIYTKTGSIHEEGKENDSN